MPTGNTEPCLQEPLATELNTNGKRVALQLHDEQPSKRLSDQRMTCQEFPRPLPIAMIEEQHEATPPTQNVSADPTQAPPQQASHLPQKYHSDYMTRAYPQVNFTPEMFRRVWFHVAVASNPNGHSYQMNLKEAVNADSFSSGVQRRLELLGYEIGSGVMVAYLDWIPWKSCLSENSDHDALMWQIWDWPGWRCEGEVRFLNIYLVLEEKVAEVEEEVETDDSDGL